VRLWSVHPRYLDTAGLTACWREALLAQKVLTGMTRGYRRHPQLERFLQGSALSAARTTPRNPQDLSLRGTDPAESSGGGPPWPGDRVVAYLHGVADEADARGYRYDRSRIAGPRRAVEPVDVTDGQVAYEWRLLRTKLATRSPVVLDRWRDVVVPEVHPLFVVVAGPVARWEVVPG